MEEKEKVNFQAELQNLSSLQAKIEETRRSLNQLAKLESSETRSMEALLRLSQVTTRNKLNLFQTHALSRSKQQAEQDHTRQRQQRVREMREREERERKEMREELRRNKENERLVVRNNSLQYDQTIRKNRQLELEKKGQLVREAKAEKQHFRETLLNSRIADKQQKEVALFNATLAKIDRQPSLARELSKLVRQKEEMEQRVAEKREAKEKVRLEIDRLKRLKEDEVAALVKDSQLAQKELSSRLLLLPLKP